MTKIHTVLFIVYAYCSLSGKADDRYTAVFLEICSNLKIDTSRVTLKKDSDGIAYCQNILKGCAEIHFNPDAFDKFPINVFVGVMCHELGHFANNDSLGCEPMTEGKADLAAGYAMRALNFDLNSAQIYLKIYSDASLRCYPLQKVREGFVRQGWDSLDKEIIAKNSYNQLVPRTTWSISNDHLLKINIGKRQFSISQWTESVDVVIVYDSITTSTIQLLEYRNQIGATGLARVITSQGFYSYFLYPKLFKSGYNYQVYYKGTIIPLDQCDKENKLDGNDLIIHCRDRDKKNIEVSFRLVDYNIAPDKYVLPAVYN